MNSHIDTQKHSREQWLSLTEYSQKYNVSISTLRRRIRANAITVKLEEGKYFIEDKQQDVAGEQDQGVETQSVETPRKKNTGKETSFIDKLLNTQQELYQLLKQKDNKIKTLQIQISDFNTLVELLEKENFTLKNQLEREKKTEEWIST